MTNPDLAKELKKMVWKDQAAAFAKRGTESIVKKHCKRMKEIINKHGFPTKEMVGDKGATDAWLLIQHCDHNVEFQEQCLRLMEVLVKNGQIEPKHVAYLEDRVLVNRGKPQRYGTQIMEGPNGEPAPRPLENSEQVDTLRKKVGLQPLAEYLERMKVVWKRFNAPPREDDLCPCGSDKKYKKCHMTQ